MKYRITVPGIPTEELTFNRRLNRWEDVAMGVWYSSVEGIRMFAKMFGGQVERIPAKGMAR